MLFTVVSMANVLNTNILLFTQPLNKMLLSKGGGGGVEL